MKTTTMTFPLEQGKEDHVHNRLWDFLLDCVADGDLELDVKDFQSMELREVKFKDSYEDEDGMYSIFEVTITGSDHSIDSLDSWQKQFKEPLQ